jgi:phosphoribosylformylglycinamidine cyclo-ligase
MAGLIRTTRGPNVLRDMGSFGGLYRLGGRWTDPVLVASTDGVGTKLHVAQLAGRHEGIGVDLVAMNVNDVLVYGAGLPAERVRAAGWGDGGDARDVRAQWV